MLEWWLRKRQKKWCYLLERFECDKSEVRFISIDTARPEILVEQLGALGCIASGLTAGRPSAKGTAERRRPRRRTLPTAAARRCRRRTQCLHRETAGGLVGLDAGIDGCFVAERTPSQRWRNNSSHQSKCNKTTTTAPVLSWSSVRSSCQWNPRSQNWRAATPSSLTSSQNFCSRHIRRSSSKNLQIYTK